MKLPNAGLDVGIALDGGLDRADPFVGGFHFSLPAIHAGDRSANLDAGGQPLFHQIPGDRPPPSALYPSWSALESRRPCRFTPCLPVESRLEIHVHPPRLFHCSGCCATYAELSGSKRLDCTAAELVVSSSGVRIRRARCELQVLC